MPKNQKVYIGLKNCHTEIHRVLERYGKGTISDREFRKKIADIIKTLADCLWIN